MGKSHVHNPAEALVFFIFQKKVYEMNIIFEVMSF